MHALMFPLPNAQQPFLTPEVTLSQEQHEPTIGPNLAVDVALGTKVCRHLIDNYWLAYELQQQRFWCLWRQLDEMWRAKVQIIDLNIPVKTYGQQVQDATMPNSRDGFTLQVSPTDMHKQWSTLLDIGLQISFDNGGLPVGAVKQDYVFETLYNPTQQTVDAANEIIAETARETDLKSEWRKNFSSFLVYGHAWSWTDLKRSFVDVDVRYRLGIDQMQAGYMLQQLSAKYPGQQPEFEQTPQGPVAVYKERRVKELYTNFRHLNKDDVFTDLLMPCSDMEQHPCPWVRQHVGEFALEQNEYHPQTNPFGWVNIKLAKKEAEYQYILSMEDEQVLVRQLMHRYNLSDQTIIRPSKVQKQLWTAYPMLRLDEQGNLDTGDGVDCPHCQGKGKMEVEYEFTESVLPMEAPGPVDCQTCEGSGKVTIPPSRFVAQFYGNPRVQGMTCIRLQKMPEGMGVPLQYAADMIEDTSCAIPTCKGEVAMNDFYIKAKAETLLLQSKDYAVNRGWKKKEGSPSQDVTPSKPGTDVPFDVDPDECTRLEANQIDEGPTLIPYIAERERRIEQILGATEELRGEIGRTHISATQASNAIDASRTPIVVAVDSYSGQAMGKWAKTLVRNLDLFGDRDWIRRKTGREYFGTLRFNTAVAEKFVKKMGEIANQRTMLEMMPNYLMAMPELRGPIKQIMQGYLQNNGMGDILIPDDGLLEAQQEAMSIVSKILGDGAMLPPMPDDPDDIFIQVFTSAVRKISMGTDYWSSKCDQTFPLLLQRLEMQKQQGMMKMQQQMAMQAQMNAVMNPQPAPGGPSSQKKGPDNSTAGKSIQGEQGHRGAEGRAA